MCGMKRKGTKLRELSFVKLQVKLSPRTCCKVHCFCFTVIDQGPRGFERQLSFHRIFLIEEDGDGSNVARIFRCLCH